MTSYSSDVDSVYASWVTSKRSASEVTCLFENSISSFLSLVKREVIAKIWTLKTIRSFAPHIGIFLAIKQIIVLLVSKTRLMKVVHTSVFVEHQCTSKLCFLLLGSVFLQIGQHGDFVPT